MTMDPGPDPGRLAAVDQELAALDDRLNRSGRSLMFGSAATAACVAAVILIEVTVKPSVYRWELVAAMIALVLAVACEFMQGLVIRNYRAEIRELRSRPAGRS